MSTETDPLLLHSDAAAANTAEETQTRTHASELTSEYFPHSKLLKLLFVVAVASTCRGTSMYSRYEYLKQFRPDLTFSEWVRLPGVLVGMELWSTWASAVVCFASIGWWSALADRRGRKPVLFISLSGTAFLDLIYMTIAGKFFHRDAISIGIIIEGLLGGFLTFMGVVHAYASDASSNSVSRTLVFGGIQAISLIFFRFGAYVGSFTNQVFSGDPHGTLGYVISAPLACVNLAYIYYTLPESLAPHQLENPPLRRSSLLKYVFSPFLTLTRKGPSSGKVVLLASAIFMYSWTSAFAGKMVTFTSVKGYFPILPVSFVANSTLSHLIELHQRWLLFVIPLLINILALLCIFPVLGSFTKRTYGDSEKSGRLLARSLAQNSILIAAVCSIGIIVFKPRSGPLYAIFFFAYPFSIGALPALYSLAASYFDALGRNSELGALFGALSIWVAWGEFFWYAFLGVYDLSLDYLVQWTAFYLIISLLLLIPSGPPTQTTETNTGRSGEEDVV
ncbi:hypothetical protein C8R45DRAFT_1221781 [Mycena sanguinolenta]|nr:hypothetical protein C8R45DRAFT_1221781 [Mycena sanguinolenta]